MIKYKCDIMQALRDAGYTPIKIRKNKLISERALTDLRRGHIIGAISLSRLCALLNCQPGDLLEYVPDGDQETAGTETADN